MTSSRLRCVSACAYKSRSGSVTILLTDQLVMSNVCQWDRYLVPQNVFLWKNSNGHISARCRPIHFMFGSTVGFSRSADRMALFPVSPNPRWRCSRHLEKFKWRYLRGGSSDLLRVFGSRTGFLVSADRIIHTMIKNELRT